MDQPITGGSAFPRPEINLPVKGDNNVKIPTVGRMVGGIDVRTWLAGMALQGIVESTINASSLANKAIQELAAEENISAQQIRAEIAVEHADALLKELGYTK